MGFHLLYTPSYREEYNVLWNISYSALQLPYYIDGDTKLTESQAILRYLGRKNGLAGSTEEDYIRIDISVGVIGDIGRAYATLCYSEDFVSGFYRELTL